MGYYILEKADMTCQKQGRQAGIHVKVEITSAMEAAGIEKYCEWYDPNECGSIVELVHAIFTAMTEAQASGDSPRRPKD